MLVTWDQHGEVLFIENGSFFGSMLLCHRKYLNLGRLLLSSHSTMELFLCIWQPGFFNGWAHNGCGCVFVSPGPSWSELTLDDQTQDTSFKFIQITASTPSWRSFNQFNPCNADQNQSFPKPSLKYLKMVRGRSDFSSQPEAGREEAWRGQDDHDGYAGKF